MARKRRLRRRRVAIAERIEPTAETVARLEIDPLYELVNQSPRLLDEADERAAHEIRAVYMAVVASVMRRGKVLGEIWGGIREMPDGLARAHAEHYLPWVRRTEAGTVQLVIDLVVDRRNGMTQAELRRCCAAIRDYSRGMG